MVVVPLVSIIACVRIASAIQPQLLGIEQVRSGMLIYFFNTQQSVRVVHCLTSQDVIFCLQIQMAMNVCVLLCLLSALVEVHSQTFPGIKFLGADLPNNSYVDFSLVGSNSEGSVKCRTDLSTCCREGDGTHRGDWYFPSGEDVPNDSDNFDIYESSKKRNVQVRRQNSAATAGIYRCDIETHAVNGNSSESLFVGLYTNGGQCEELIN